MTFALEDDPDEPGVQIDPSDEPRALSRSAGLLIEIIPTGTPGKVFLDISNVGPEQLSTRESLNTLRSAIAMVELALQDQAVLMPGFKESDEH